MRPGVPEGSHPGGSWPWACSSSSELTCLNVPRRPRCLSLLGGSHWCHTDKAHVQNNPPPRARRLRKPSGPPAACSWHRRRAGRTGQPPTGKRAFILQTEAEEAAGDSAPGRRRAQVPGFACARSREQRSALSSDQICCSACPVRCRRPGTVALPEVIRAAACATHPASGSSCWATAHRVPGHSQTPALGL